MKIAIMQPYFLPYIGYWKLIESVDKFVIYDDVQFMKGGWVNRNQILINGEKKFISLPVKKHHLTANINEIIINKDNKSFASIYNKVLNNYKKSEYFNDVFRIFEKIYYYESNNLSEYLIHSIKTIMSYLSINTEIIKSSDLQNNKSLKSKDKVIDICKILGATYYYNLPGGKKLYNYKDFDINRIKLTFLDNDYSENEFISILDTLFSTKIRL